MISKKLWLASAALVALATAGQARAGGVYVSVFGGANFQPNDSSRAGGGGSFQAYAYDPDTGFAIGGAIGTGLDNWVRGLRIELEASYRRNDVGGAWTTGTSVFASTGVIDANASTFALMANVAYDIDVGWKFKPYVMAGAGWARSHYEGVHAYTGGGTRDSFDLENSGFAFNLGAGVNYEVAPGVDVGIGYRYFDGPNTSASFFAGKFGSATVKHENNNHAVMLNLTIDTN
jgi:opacity protein-like surface antigen